MIGLSGPDPATSKPGGTQAAPWHEPGSGPFDPWRLGAIHRHKIAAGIEDSAEIVRRLARRTGYRPDRFRRLTGFANHFSMNWFAPQCTSDLSWLNAGGPVNRRYLEVLSGA